MKRDDSAITRRRTPARKAAIAVRDWLLAAGRYLLKDKLSLFLLVAALVVSFLFFSLLDDIQPSSPGDEAALSTITQLANDDQITSAVLLDYDSRVVVETADGRTLWAAYPGSHAPLHPPMRLLGEWAQAPVTMDQQANKPTDTIIVQFLLPILLLVCLFALFTRLG